MFSRSIRFMLPLACAAHIAGISPSLRGQGVLLPSEAVLIASRGLVEVVGANDKATALTADDSPGAQPAMRVVSPGELIRTAPDAFCDVLIPSAGTLRLLPGTEVRLPAKPDADPARQHSLELLKGKLFLDIDAAELGRRRQGQFRLKTPATVLAVRGTRFFAASEPGLDTAGVHKGQVGVTDARTGKAAALAAGQAVDVKEGSLRAVRAFSGEETGYATHYSESALRLSPMEGATRKADVSYQVNRDPATAIHENLRGMIRVEKVKDPRTEGQTLLCTLKPNLKFPDSGTFATLSVELDAKLPPNPVALVFLARSQEGVLKTFAQAQAGRWNGKDYGTPDRSSMVLPREAKPGEWTTVVVPLIPDAPPLEAGARYQMKFSLDPRHTLDGGKIVESEATVDTRRDAYSFEIGPIRVLHRVRE